MKIMAHCRPCLILTFAALVLLSHDAGRSQAFADSPPLMKGPEISTVGTGPYLGPLPAELEKLAALEASTQPSPPSAKEPAATTITPGGGNTLTVNEQAKLAAFQAIVRTLPVPFMPKLKLMQVSKNGIPVLTAQEREKHARERTTLTAPQTAPRSGR